MANLVMVEGQGIRRSEMTNLVMVGIRRELVKGLMEKAE